MSTAVNKYRIFCNIEQIWVESWGTVPPTVCANDTNHEINPNSIQELQTISQNEVFVNTERIATGGNFRTVGFMREIPASTVGDTFVFDTSYPYPINLSLVSFRTDVNASGDMISADAAPDTIIGVLTADSLGITTILNVSSTVVENIKIGFQCGLSTGVTSYDVGECIDIDIVNNTITIQNIPTDTIVAGAVVSMSLRNISNYVLSNSQTKVIGTGKIGASYIPANTILRLTYTNNNGESKRFFVDNEFTY